MQVYTMIQIKLICDNCLTIWEYFSFDCLYWYIWTNVTKELLYRLRNSSFFTFKVNNLRKYVFNEIRGFGSEFSRIVTLALQNSPKSQPKWNLTESNLTGLWLIFVQRHRKPIELSNQVQLGPLFFAFSFENFKIKFNKSTVHSSSSTIHSSSLSPVLSAIVGWTPPPAWKITII